MTHFETSRKFAKNKGQNYRVSNGSCPNFACLSMLISLSYVNIMEYSINRVIRKANTMIHAKMPQKNAENFGLIFSFCDFLPNFEDFKPILATLDKLQ